MYRDILFLRINAALTWLLKVKITSGVSLFGMGARSFCAECGMHLFYKLKENGAFNMSAGIFSNVRYRKNAYWQNEETAAVAIRFDDELAMSGNGTVLGFGVDSLEEVKRLHKKRLN